MDGPRHRGRAIQYPVYGASRTAALCLHPGSAFTRRQQLFVGLPPAPSACGRIGASAFAFSCIEITSQLYLLDYISRQGLNHCEPIRIFASADHGRSGLGWAFTFNET
jgi:hypothetical protein